MRLIDALGKVQGSPEQFMNIVDACDRITRIIEPEQFYQFLDDIGKLSEIDQSSVNAPEGKRRDIMRMLIMILTVETLQKHADSIQNLLKIETPDFGDLD